MRWASLHCFPLSPPPVIAALPFHTLLLECRTTSRGGQEGRQFACSRRRRRLPHLSLPRSRYHPPPPLQGHCFDPAHSMLGPLDRPSSEPLLFLARRILSSFWARGVNVAYPVSPSSIICRRGRERREVGTPDTLDTRNSPSLPIALPPLFHAVSLCHWHIVRRPGRKLPLPDFLLLPSEQTLVLMENGLLKLLANEISKKRNLLSSVLCKFHFTSPCFQCQRRQPRSSYCQSPKSL